MIQEAHIMGFEIVQAGALSEHDDPRLPLELAVLANSFGYLPPPGGMTGPRVGKIGEALGVFDFDSYGETPRIDFLSGTGNSRGVYAYAGEHGALVGKAELFDDGKMPIILLDGETVLKTALPFGSALTFEDVTLLLTVL